jgi:anaerobic magnesium-protoporphyrin IX monomethyl ester cyclase
MRSDCILRDEKLGIMEKLVKAGLSHTSIGAERASNSELDSIGKECYKVDMVKNAMHILRAKYPQIFRQVTFIVGIRDETRDSMLKQLVYAKELGVDYPAFHPMTPVPGTKLWDDAKRNGWLEITDFSYYDWSTPVMSSKYLSRYEIDELLYFLNKKYASLSWLLKGLLSRYSYKRNMYIWWVLVVIRMLWDSIFNFITPFKAKSYIRLIKPKWYDS